MAPGRQRDPQKEQQWRQWIALWQHSGLSVADFCQRHHLATATFYASPSKVGGIIAPLLL